MHHYTSSCKYKPGWLGENHLLQRINVAEELLTIEKNLNKMLTMSPFAPLLKPDLYWFSTVSMVCFSQWVVYACFCAIVIVVSLGLRCRFWRRPLRRLFSLVGWTGTLAPEMCIPQYGMAIACLGRKKGCPQGEVTGRSNVSAEMLKFWDLPVL